MNLGQSHPELVRRFNLLVNEVWSHGWEIGVTSSTRSRATQEDLYRRWLAGTYKVPSVANPNGVHGPSPWGWTILGSYHMPQADGFSHALDLNWRGCTPWEFEKLANRCGLQRTVPNENWHYQWFNRQVIFPVAPEHTEEEVTPADYKGIADALLDSLIPTTYDVGTPQQRDVQVPLRNLLGNFGINLDRLVKEP